MPVPFQSNPANPLIIEPARFMNCLKTIVLTTAKPSVLQKTDARRLTDWLPLLVLPSMAIVLFASAKPWVLMWVIACAVYSGSKWLTWRRGRVAGSSTWRNWAYLFLWPGMDARGFLDPRRRAARPTITNWAVGVSEILFGALLLWGIARRVPASQPLLQGWIGMTGCIFLLHFGLFQLLALLWQSFGINARPLMRAPIMAESLADFWGHRWNSAFNRIAHDLVFRPLHRRLGVPLATLFVFLVSGLVHDLILSVPARGGYGLPTAYFLLQGFGLLLERSKCGEKIGLRRGLAGRCFAVAITAIPAFWLFNPAFIRNVILPMLHAFGAT